MNKNQTREVIRMTTKDIEAIKIIAEKSNSKEEFLKLLDRIQNAGKKKTPSNG